MLIDFVSPLVSQGTSRFHEEDFSGHGTYGKVWLCHDKITNKKVVIKSSNDQKDSREMLIHEFDIMKLFDDEHIIKPLKLTS
jgi:serine/threonine protein kinase